MVSALQQAFARLYTSIPIEILNAAFEPHKEDTSLDDIIRRNVIIPQVLPDMSIRGGRILRLILDTSWTEYVNPPTNYLGIMGSHNVYRIPAEAREHRDISAVLSVSFPYHMVGSGHNALYNSCGGSGNSLAAVANQALSSQTFANVISPPTAMLYQNNLIKLEPTQLSVIPWQVTVRLAYDENFTQMSVSEIQPFCKLIEYAVKAYIYNTLIVPVESNYVKRGQTLGVMKDIISTYSDATEKYDEQLILVGGAAIQDENDGRLMSILRRMVPAR